MVEGMCRKGMGVQVPLRHKMIKARTCRFVVILSGGLTILSKIALRRIAKSHPNARGTLMDVRGCSCLLAPGGGCWGSIRGLWI